MLSISHHFIITLSFTFSLLLVLKLVWARLDVQFTKFCRLNVIERVPITLPCEESHPKSPPTSPWPGKVHATWEEHATVEFPVNHILLQSNKLTLPLSNHSPFWLSVLSEWHGPSKRCDKNLVTAGPGEVGWNLLDKDILKYVNINTTGFEHWILSVYSLWI